MCDYACLAVQLWVMDHCIACRKGGFWRQVALSVVYATRALELMLIHVAQSMESVLRKVSFVGQGAKKKVQEISTL